MSLRLGLGLRIGAGVQVVQPTAFNYLDLPGILVAHEADQGVTLGTGSNVATWGDISGNGATSTAVASSEPQFIASHANFGGNPAIDFGAALPLGFDMSIANAASDYTIVALLDVLNTAADQILLGTAPGGSIFRVMAQRSTGVGWYDGAYKFTGTVTSGAQVLAWKLKAGTGTAKVYRNSVQIGTAQNYTARACGSPIRLGRHESTGSDYLRAEVGRFVIAAVDWDETTQLIPAMNQFAEWIP